MSETSERRRLILRLLAEQPIASQAALAELLEEAGQGATQSQISRDLRALHVAKRDGIYRPTERITPLGRLATLLRDARPAGPNLVVVRCEPGGAQAIARALEAEELAGVIGVVAGDDTLFAAVESKARGKNLITHIEGLIE